jgi:hypothetical protein
LPGDSSEELKAALAAYPTLSAGEPAEYPTGFKSTMLSQEQDRGGVAYRRHMPSSDFVPVVRFPFNGTTVDDLLASYDQLAPGKIEGDHWMRAVQPGVGTGRWLRGSRVWVELEEKGLI